MIAYQVIVNYFEISDFGTRFKKTEVINTYSNEGAAIECLNDLVQGNEEFNKYRLGEGIKVERPKYYPNHWSEKVSFDIIPLTIYDNYISS